MVCPIFLLYNTAPECLDYSVWQELDSCLYPSAARWIQPWSKMKQALGRPSHPIKYFHQVFFPFPSRWLRSFQMGRGERKKESQRDSWMGQTVMSCSCSLSAFSTAWHTIQVASLHLQSFPFLTETNFPSNLKSFCALCPRINPDYSM